MLRNWRLGNFHCVYLSTILLEMQTSKIQIKDHVHGRSGLGENHPFQGTVVNVINILRTNLYERCFGSFSLVTCTSCYMYIEKAGGVVKVDIDEVDTEIKLKVDTFY